MEISEIIKKNKVEILNDLFEWAETFDWELDEEGERILDSYNFVFGLAEKLDKNICSYKNYVDILFHIEQINYLETKITFKF
jgi:hypothetical protein